jgi:single-stranded-DNA-specific exonuclease
MPDSCAELDFNGCFATILNVHPHIDLLFTQEFILDAVCTSWHITEPQIDLRTTLARTLNISPLVSQVLINRGFDSPDKARSFLSARLNDLHSPFLMKDMHRAVERIIVALGRQEHICIYGDYDVDGVTATAVLALFLKRAGGNVSFYIPERQHEGYGLNVEALDRIRSQRDARLLITVDCGISDLDEVMYANSRGMDVIVTDHHEMPEAQAPAYATLNPKQPDCSFPFKGLAGVGVAFNLVMALRKTLRERGAWANVDEPNLREYLDLVALGTIADIVPMVDENRIFVRNGLDELSRSERPGIKALKSVCGLENEEVTVTTVAYRLAPRLNAAGRIADAALAVELLLCENLDEAVPLASQIDQQNTRRRQVEGRTLTDARKQLDPYRDDAALVLASNDWHPGVMGLCASRLAEEFLRPVVMIACDERKGTGRGSVRGVEGFNIYAAVKKCASLLKTYGGHKGAAGLSVTVSNIEDFRARFNESCSCAGQAAGIDSQVIMIDAEIALQELTYGVVQDIEALAPFGSQNPEPVFCSPDLKYYSHMMVGNGHLKLKIKESGRFYDAIGFNMASRFDPGDNSIKLAFVPQINTFNGQKSIQLKLRDIKCN